MHKKQNIQPRGSRIGKRVRKWETHTCNERNCSTGCCLQNSIHTSVKWEFTIERIRGFNWAWVSCLYLTFRPGLLPLNSPYMIPYTCLARGPPEIKSFRSPWGMKESLFKIYLHVIFRRYSSGAGIGGHQYFREVLWIRWVGFPLDSTSKKGVALFFKADIIFT